MQPTAAQRLAAFVRAWLMVPGLVACTPPPLAPGLSALQAPARQAEADPMIRARQHYNKGEYEQAVQAAGEAMLRPELRNAAALLLGRSALERYRATADPTDLTRARNALRTVDATSLPARDRNDLIIGLGEALFFDGQYRPAADMFESMLDQAGSLGPAQRDQVLDWWGTAIDRHVRQLPSEERAPAYDRLIERMEEEMRRDAASSAAAYWVAAAAYSRGQVDRAWDAAVAGYVRAIVAWDRGATLRPDLDRLVREAIIPERVRRLPVAGTPEGEQAHAGMLAEWDLIKDRWGGS
jgi:tetratricopeptide (TPR) repeat protein